MTSFTNNDKNTNQKEIGKLAILEVPRKGMPLLDGPGLISVITCTHIDVYKLVIFSIEFQSNSFS